MIQKPEYQVLPCESCLRVRQNVRRVRHQTGETIANGIMNAR